MMKAPLRFKPVFYINGVLLLILSAMMLMPMLIDYAHQSDGWRIFAGAQITTAFVGFALMFTNREEKFTLNLRETFLLSSISWLMLSAFSALPFYFSHETVSYTQAFFESMSGLTTTGATVLTGLDDLPKGILFWRHMLQWLGGIGFLIIALSVLPLLQISGMQIFKSQSFTSTEKILPSAAQIATHIFSVYVALTVACTMLFFVAGMTFFDATSHALSTVSTGGFSTHDASIGFFRNPLIEWITIIFMISGAVPFVLYLRMLRGDREALFTDSQVRGFLGILLTLTLLVAADIFMAGHYGLHDSFRHALFTISSLMTTTGFASTDYSTWGAFAVGVAFIATFLGACSGSTSGGLKTFRLQILWAVVQQQIRKLIVPHGVFQVHYSGKIVEPSVQTSVAAFFFVHIMTWMVITILLHMTGLDFMTSVSGAITAVSNVGPGLGDLIGPAGTFSTLSADAIWILSIAMLLGRMEFLTLFVLLAPRFWRG